MKYFLTTARLGFRCWSEDDLPLAAELWGDSGVMALMGGPLDVGRVRGRLEEEIAHVRDFNFQYWPFFLLRGNRFAGCAGLRPRGHQTRPEPTDRAFQMGYHLLPAFWGQGIATEAAQAVIDHSFASLGAETLFAAHHPQNERSRRVLLKLGFTAAGTEFYPPTGLMHPSYLLTRNEHGNTLLSAGGGVEPGE